MSETAGLKRVRPRRVKESVGTSIAESAHTRSGRILVWGLALLWTVPTFGVFVSSFRPEADVKSTGWWTFFLHPTHFTFANYNNVLSTGPGSDGLSHYLLNSFRITIPSVIISVGVAALAAYGFSWIEFKGRDWLYSLILAMLIVPLQMCLIPILRPEFEASLGIRAFIGDSASINTYLFYSKSRQTVEGYSLEASAIGLRVGLSGYLR